MSNKATYRVICEQPRVPVFQQPWWLDAVCAEWDVAISRKGDMVTGVWPYAIDKKIGVSILRNPILTPYMGPVVYLPTDIKESNADSFEHEAISELIKQIPDAKVWHLGIQPGIKQSGIFKKHKLEAVAKQTFLLPLGEPEEALFANIKESARRNIKQAEKEITITNEPELLKELHAFQKNTLEGKGAMQAASLADMRKAMTACLANNSAALWVARSGGVVQAITWQVWDDERGYYLAGGQNHETNGYKAMTALLWHMIKESKKRGHSVFDFEGSMDEGVERFFRSFGAKRELYLVLQRNESTLWKLKKMIRG